MDLACLLEELLENRAWQMTFRFPFAAQNVQSILNCCRFPYGHADRDALRSIPLDHDFAAGFGDFLVDGLADMELVHDDGGIGQALLHISTVAAGHIHRYDLDIGVAADHALNGCNDGIVRQSMM